MDNHDIESLPLVRIRGSSIKERRRRRLLVCAVAASIIVAILVALLSNARSAEDSNTFDVVTKPSDRVSNVNEIVGGIAKTGSGSSAQTDCSTVCSAMKEQLTIAYGGDIMAKGELLRVVTAAREKAIAVLKEQYGEKYFSSIFEEERHGERVLRKAVVAANTTSEISSEKFKRKLMIKLLSVQTELLDKAKSHEGCDCLKTGGGVEQGNRQRQLQGDDDKAKPKLFATFIWATGGHSSAAGHGNLLNESYTAFMERTAKDVFASVGIDFIGKNYAMGGTTSAPEIALCIEAIFGPDPDAVSWDFGMTDGKESSRMLLYNYRASVLPSRPAVVGIDLGKRKFRKDNYVYCDNDGIPSFVLEPGEEKNMMVAIPDSLGLSEEQLVALPPFVRSFKCDGKIEVGDPYCDAEKYSSAICPDRKFKANWHPGWKAHALKGNAVALFLIEALVDAAKDLASKSVDPFTLLAELKAQEDVEYNKFLTSVLPPLVLTQLKSQVYDEVEAAVVFKGPVVCHTAHLPAETRFLGYLTESEKKGIWDYDKGISRREINANPPAQKDQSPMRLVYDEDVRQNCPVPLTIDFKDYFFTSTADGWTTLTVPNDSEAKAYRYDSTKVKGIIVVCFTGCDWGVCAKGTILAKDINEGKSELEVNGMPVKSLDKFDLCSVLRGESGLEWKPNSDGRFVLRARTSEPDSYIRISSVVVL